MERLILGVVLALLLLQIVEAVAGENTANWFAFVLLMGVVVYQRDGLQTFAAQIQSRLR